MVANASDPQSAVRDLFGVAIPAGTGAGGNPLADVTSSPDVGAVETVTVRDAFQSTQTPGDRVSVDRSDTASASMNAYDGQDGFNADADRSYGNTGAGEGRGHAPHPNSMDVPSMAVQIQRARSHS